MNKLVRFVVIVLVLSNAFLSGVIFQEHQKYKQLKWKADEEYQAFSRLVLCYDKAFGKAMNFLDWKKYEIRFVTATGYAPLDPKAIKGICHDGTPERTANNSFTIPGVTVAAGKDIPLGTWVWVDGFGWRIVEDRGGAIKNGQIDICFKTQAEAKKWGRRIIKIIIPKGQ